MFQKIKEYLGLVPTEGEYPGSIFDDIKERVANPFISSFMISWIFWNWRIFIGLIFLQRSDLPSGLTWIDFVSSELDFYRSLLWPIVSALAYCGLFPLISLGIKRIQAGYLRWSYRVLNKVGKNVEVPISNFYVIKKDILDTQERLKGWEKSETEMRTKTLQLEGTLLETSTKLNASEAINNKWSTYSTKSMMKGIWRIEYLTLNRSELVRITDEEYWEHIESDGEQPNNLRYRFWAMYGNALDETIVILLEDPNILEKHTIHRLTIRSGWATLEGTEGYRVSIRYVKIA